MADIIPVVLSFLWAFFWPLLFVRAKDIFAGYSLTKRKLAACAVIAAVISTTNSIFNIAFIAYGSLALIMILSALVPIVLLAYNKAVKRTRVKLLILAAYFHIFWQLLPGISIYPIAIDLAIVAVLVFLAKTKFKRRHKLQDKVLTHGSISEIWK